MKVQTAVKASSIAYQSVTELALLGDIQRIGRLYTQSFIGCIMEERPPLRSELKAIAASARQRVSDNIPLEALLNSYRVCIRTLWDFVAERSAPDQLGKFAMLTLDYNDVVSTAATNAFISERERQSRSRYDAASHLLIQTILGSEAATDELETAARDVGIGTAGPWTAIEVALSESSNISARSSSEHVMSRIHDSMQNRFGWALTAVVPRGLLFVVPHQHLEWASEAVQRDAETLPGVVRVGYSMPCSTLTGLPRAYREADRAVEIGALVMPHEFTHSYERLMMFDLFQEGRAITQFVVATLGALLQLNPSKQQRFMATLSAFFDCAHSRKRTAAKLGIHHNTLALRLDEIDSLLGVDLASGRDSFRLQLAIYLLPMADLSEGRNSDAGRK